MEEFTHQEPVQSLGNKNDFIQALRTNKTQIYSSLNAVTLITTLKKTGLTLTSWIDDELNKMDDLTKKMDILFNYLIEELSRLPPNEAEGLFELITNCIAYSGGINLADEISRDYRELASARVYVDFVDKDSPSVPSAPFESPVVDPNQKLITSFFQKKIPRYEEQVQSAVSSIATQISPVNPVVPLISRENSPNKLVALVVSQETSPSPIKPIQFSVQYSNTSPIRKSNMVASYQRKVQGIQRMSVKETAAPSMTINNCTTQVIKTEEVDAVDKSAQVVDCENAQCTSDSVGNGKTGEENKLQQQQDKNIAVVKPIQKNSSVANVTGITRGQPSSTTAPVSNLAEVSDSSEEDPDDYDESSLVSEVEEAYYDNYYPDNGLAGLFGLPSSRRSRSRSGVLRPSGNAISGLKYGKPIYQNDFPGKRTIRQIIERQNSSFTDFSVHSTLKIKKILFHDIDDMYYMGCAHPSSNSGGTCAKKVRNAGNTWSCEYGHVHTSADNVARLNVVFTDSVRETEDFIATVWFGNVELLLGMNFNLALREDLDTIKQIFENQTGRVYDAEVDCKRCQKATGCWFDPFKGKMWSNSVTLVSSSAPSSRPSKSSTTSNSSGTGPGKSPNKRMNEEEKPQGGRTYSSFDPKRSKC